MGRAASAATAAASARVAPLVSWMAGRLGVLWISWARRHPILLHVSVSGQAQTKEEKVCRPHTYACSAAASDPDGVLRPSSWPVPG